MGLAADRPPSIQSTMFVIIVNSVPLSGFSFSLVYTLRFKEFCFVLRTKEIAFLWLLSS